MGGCRWRDVACLVLALCMASAGARAQEAPPSMDPGAPPAEENGGEAPPPIMGGDAPAEDGANSTIPSSFANDIDSGVAPPSMDMSDEGVTSTPLAPAVIPPPPDRPFLQRLNVLEVALMTGGLLGGWALAAGTFVAATALFTSVAAGRPAYDLPVLVARGALTPTSLDTGAARILGAGGGAFMLGALATTALVGAVLAGTVAAALGNLSADWSTSPGPVIATGVLAAAVCMAAGTALFMGSLLVPVPPLWAATFVLAGALCVVVPPVAVVVGQLLTKTARPAPGGVVYKFLDTLLSNPLVRKQMGGL